MSIVGSIGIKNVTSVTNAEAIGDCFKVNDSEGDNWILCANSEMEKKEWVCAIN